MAVQYRGPQTGSAAVDRFLLPYDPYKFDVPEFEAKAQYEKIKSRVTRSTKKLASTSPKRSPVKPNAQIDKDLNAMRLLSLRFKLQAQQRDEDINALRTLRAKRQPEQPSDSPTKKSKPEDDEPLDSTAPTNNTLTPTSSPL